MTVLGELDTVTDLIEYLIAKEELFSRGTVPSFAGGEEDLLALYLHRGRQFQLPPAERTYLPGDLWDQFTAKQEYKAKKEADRVSYVWDRIVDLIGQHVLGGTLEFGSSLSEDEIGLRVLARERRFARRALADRFLEVIRSADVEARMYDSPSGIVYVFLVLPTGVDRQFRRANLANRCFIARGQHPDSHTVIGLATERHEAGQLGASFDLEYLRIPEWTPPLQEHMEAMQRELGYFANPRRSTVRTDEYPKSS